MAGPGGGKNKMNSSNKPVKMTMLAKKSLAIQKKKLAKCAAAAKAQVKNVVLKKCQDLKRIYQL